MTDIRKIIIATDSFKGSLSSSEAGKAIAEAASEMFPSAEVRVLPVADGGEGTTEALCTAMSGKQVRTQVSGPLGNPVSAEYGIIPGGTAVMEMAQASGLVLISPEERNPMLASTYGTGQMVMDAFNRGCRSFLIGIGGSATNDGGTGMLTALGYRFIDRNGHALDGCGESLARIAAIDGGGVPQELRRCRFRVACDVDTPFCGPDGASFVFAPQKGADMVMAAELDRGMRSFADVAERFTGIRIHDIPGSGAAGGLGGAFKAFLGAELEPGIEMVLDTVRFDDMLDGCGLVITGEGRMDSQTLHGKTPYGIMRHAVARGIRTVAFCGRLESPEVLVNAGFSGIYEVDARGMALHEAMLPANAYRNLRDTARRVFASMP